VWNLPPKKLLKLTTPQTAAKLQALNLFFDWDNELQIYHGSFLLMDNKQGNYSSLSNQNGENLCLNAQK